MREIGVDAQATHLCCIPRQGTVSRVPSPRHDRSNLKAYLAFQCLKNIYVFARSLSLPRWQLRKMHPFLRYIRWWVPSHDHSVDPVVLTLIATVVGSWTIWH